MYIIGLSRVFCSIVLYTRSQCLKYLYINVEGFVFHDKMFDILPVRAEETFHKALQCDTIELQISRSQISLHDNFTDRVNGIHDEKNIDKAMDDDGLSYVISKAAMYMIIVDYFVQVNLLSFSMTSFSST